MIHTVARTFVVALSFLPLLSTGCAWLPKPPVEDVTPQRSERKETIVKNFEMRRSQAQYDAAVLRWERSDFEGCETILNQLLARDPTNQDARQLLADLYVAQEKPTAAMEQLKILLEHAPENPQSHHALGMLLESIGRSNEAATHYRQALAANPANELYQLSLDSIAGESSSVATRKRR